MVTHPLGDAPNGRVSLPGLASRAGVEPALRPDQFVRRQRNRALEALRVHGRTASPEPLVATVKPTRNRVLDHVYDRGVVDASPLTTLIADKLLMFVVLEYFLGTTVTRFHPRSIGLKQLLDRYRLTDAGGAVRAGRADIAEVLDHEFPQGCLLKPTFDMGSGGTRLATEREAIVDGIAGEAPELYTRDEFAVPYAPADGVPLSGERLFFMGLVPGALAATRNLPGEEPAGDGIEVRLHTLHDRLVEESTLLRWNTPGVEDNEMTRRGEAFVEALLGELPPEFTDAQAFSFDVFVSGDDARAIEINTNRGERTNWSGILKRGDVLGAYVRHLERRFGWKFEGPEGAILRHDLGNIRQHIRGEIEFVLRDIEMLPDSGDLALTKLKKLAREFGDKFDAMSAETAATPYMRAQRAAFETFRERALRAERVGDEAWGELMVWYDEMS